jgi:hypothetical protein
MQVRAVADSNALPRSSYTDSTGPGSSFEVAHFSREAAAARSRGVSPRYRSNEYRHLSREAATADAIAVAASRLDALSCFFLQADARSYVPPSLRDSQLCNFKECERGTELKSLADASGCDFLSGITTPVRAVARTNRPWRPTRDRSRGSGPASVRLLRYSSASEPRSAQPDLC